MNQPRALTSLQIDNVADLFAADTDGSPSIAPLSKMARRSAALRTFEQLDRGDDGPPDWDDAA